MKTITFILLLVIFVCSPTSAFCSSCAIVSRVQVGQYVRLHVIGTLHGTLSGKVTEVNPKNCIIAIATTADYRTYYVDAESITAIGVKPQR